ncbi:MAG: penicillin-binding protein activator [Thalassovita sp.]|nr:penicillin-binding protein activator [Thalassovita sp.]
MFAVFQAARKAIAPLAAFLSLIALAACEPTPFGGPSINTSAPVPVALLVPSGSENTGDDLLAQSLENAARLAISDLDGVNIDLRVYATAGDPAQARAMAVEAVRDGAKIILGPVYGESANAAAVAVASRGVNVLSFSNNTTIAGGNLFILGPTFQNTADRLVSFAGSQGKGRIVVAHDTGVAGQLGRNSIASAVSRSPETTLVSAVPYERSQQGVIEAIPMIRDEVQNGADSVFLTALTEGALPLLTQLLDESGVDPETTQYIGLTRWDIPPQTLELPSVQGGWFALPDPTMTQRFSSRYTAAFGTAPHAIGGLSYDGIAAIGALVNAGHSDALTAGALTQSAGFQGVNGIFRMHRDGTNERGLAVAQIQNKQVVVIDPAPRSFAGPGF